MFKKILIVCRSHLSQQELKVVEQVKEFLFDRDFCLVISENLKKEYLKNLELVITIGGDGTFLRTSHFLKNTPILGINSDPKMSEGALTSVNSGELEKLRDILNGSYKVIKRSRIRVKRNGNVLEEEPLNEVYVGTEKQFYTSKYVLCFNGEEEKHRSSGVLVVTGSGSNAWYKSAGGLPFHYVEKKLRFLVREPFFSNRLFKPKILQGEINQGEKIKFIGKSFDRGVIALDSNAIYPFNQGDIVEIELSDKPLNVICKK